jgi:hypothetical protein
MARHHLLRCYLDDADAENARELLEKFPDDRFCCFIYSKALIEYISVQLAEHGTCEEKRDAILYEGRVIAP